MNRSAQRVIIREIALLLLLLTVIMTTATVMSQLKIEASRATETSEDFQSYLRRDQDTLLLQLLLGKAQDLNFYFEGLKAKFPNLSLCLSFGADFSGLGFTCEPGVRYQESFTLLGNRNYLVLYSVEKKSWMTILIDLLHTPIFFSTIISLFMLSLFLNFRLRSLLSKPLIQLNKNIEEIASGERTLTPLSRYGVREWETINLTLRDLTTYIEQLEKEEYEAGQVKVARQMAHDIRSPLSLLKVAVQVFTDLPAEKRAMVSSAVERIEEIVNSLNPRQLPLKSDCTIAPLISSVIEEKRTIFHHKIALDISADAKDASVHLNPATFKRIVSNLLNNSIEALEPGGLVTVQMSVEKSNLHIRVLDTGKGIPNSAKPLIEAGGTLGKISGQGLGLSHARAAIDSWGGKLMLDSIEKVGTILLITLPVIRKADDRNPASIGT